MISDRVEQSPLVAVSRFDSTPLPYTDIVREDDGREIKRTRFYMGCDEGVVVRENIDTIDRVTNDDMNIGSFVSPAIIIASGDNKVIIDFSGDEVVVTGANEKGAKIFFEGMLKPMIDNYIKENEKE